MDQRDFPWGRVLVAATLALVLNLAGVIWIGLSQERQRHALAALERDVRALPAPPACPDTAAIGGDVRALRQSVATLTEKVEALRRSAGDDKALNRLAGEVKALSAKVASLASAKTTPKAAKSRKTPTRQPAPESGYYGPGYPGWPGY